MEGRRKNGEDGMGYMEREGRLEEEEKGVGREREQMNKVGD